MWTGHVGVHEHGDVEAGERRRAERLGEGGRGEHAEAEAAVLLGHAQSEHAELAHLAEHLTGDLAGLFPRITVGRDLLGHEVDGLLVDRLELVGHVGVTHLRSPREFRT